MNIDERMLTYIRSLDREESVQLQSLRREAAAGGVPVIRPETASLLKVLLRLKKPQRLLEVGGGVGFSSVWMSEYAGGSCAITTIEKDEERVIRARKNIRSAGREGQITLLAGDAAEILKKLTPAYDFIFMDAAKGQYLYFFPEIMRLLSPDGLLVCDNVLQEGDIIESRYAVRRRDRTIHRRMRAYLWELTHNEELETQVLTVGDGVSVSIKITDKTMTDGIED